MVVATFLALGACAAAEAADAGKLIASSEPDWPQWRGPRRDAVSDETGLLDAWPDAGPKLLWKVADVGKGWCSPIITNGTLYIGGDVDGAARDGGAGGARRNVGSPDGDNRADAGQHRD